MKSPTTLTEERADVPAANIGAALEQPDEVPHLSPVIRQVDIIEEKTSGDDNERFVKIVVKDFEGQERGTFCSDPEVIPVFGPGNIPAAFVTIRTRDLDGNEHVMEEYDGKVKLITNVASLSKDARKTYDELRQIYDRFLPQGFEILAFPCQQYVPEEYVHTEDIKTFLADHNVGFPVFEMTAVNGPETHPVFLYCKWNSDEFYRDGQLNNLTGHFGKFLLDRDNRVYKFYPPDTNPLRLVEDIKKLLNGELTGKIRGPDGKLYHQPGTVSQENQTTWS
ncbi:peroxiredoxin PRX2 [Toxoplasma gondii RUB]|uniref:Glutathione peroxidase n=2 Tax=Toxoplasma gondii TaxID=5811 RepID=A0A086LK05_TOXGO|nr:peroxiredoxin PRX2 [Toxoplasma gondii RUB]KFH01514.1 peroxiredoxin PRX2 [Toxoplasma gondii VAND]